MTCVDVFPREFSTTRVQKKANPKSTHLNRSRDVTIGGNCQQNYSFGFSTVTGAPNLKRSSTKVMHLEERPGINTAMEKTTTEATTIGYGSTGIYLNFANMSFEEIQRRLDNFSQEQPEHLDILQDQRWRIATVVIYSIVILFGFLENMI
ncbi:hypothetical protein MAR_001665 [Mya arenaria]|uniref:Uncharacterized protein n=1 Tax=Mya arenaria TaxID=6604 RepID=A0ABY7FFQ6_MYAAR|nr:hypothetical protein MAR_001665 [Mya arenaria]